MPSLAWMAGLVFLTLYFTLILRLLPSVSLLCLPGYIGHLDTILWMIRMFLASGDFFFFFWAGLYSESVT